MCNRYHTVKQRLVSFCLVFCAGFVARKRVVRTSDPGVLKGR